jgi:arsenite methyltransferase
LTTAAAAVDRAELESKVTGVRRHGGRRVLAVAGAAVIAYAMFVQYHALVELLRSVLLASGVLLDLKLRSGTDRAA